MPIKFSKKEIKDLVKAWFFVSLAFAIVISGGDLGISLITNILLAAFTLGIGFLLHELGHKVVAQRYGCFAEFRADNFMLFLAILTSFLGIIFAAPGAVMIAGRVTKEKFGKISIAGPLVNILLTIIFLIGALIFTSGFLGTLFAFGAIINSWLAIFNLIPLWIFDGKKVLAWSKSVYIISMTIAIILFVLIQVLPIQQIL